MGRTTAGALAGTSGRMPTVPRCPLRPLRPADRLLARSGPQHPQLAPLPDPPDPASAPRAVVTQNGIPNFRDYIMLPANPCPRCRGTGKVLCGSCRGKGRLNYRSAPMLPKGVWPQWCRDCRASGRWHCERCMGTGVRRQALGFRPPDAPPPPQQDGTTGSE